MKVLSCIAACLVTVSLVAPLAAALAVCFTRARRGTIPTPSRVHCLVTEQPDAFTLFDGSKVMTI